MWSKYKITWRQSYHFKATHVPQDFIYCINASDSFPFNTDIQRICICLSMNFCIFLAFCLFFITVKVIRYSIEIYWKFRKIRLPTSEFHLCVREKGYFQLGFPRKLISINTQRKFEKYKKYVFFTIGLNFEGCKDD